MVQARGLSKSPTPNDWDQGVFSEANQLYNEEKERMMCITTDATSVPDGESKEKQKITGVTMHQ